MIAVPCIRTMYLYKTLDKEQKWEEKENSQLYLAFLLLTEISHKTTKSWQAYIVMGKDWWSEFISGSLNAPSGDDSEPLRVLFTGIRYPIDSEWA